MVAGGLITWFTVSVSSLVYKGLGTTTSSIEVRALESSKAADSKDDEEESRINQEESQKEKTEHDSSTGDIKRAGYTPFKSIMNKSRPSSRRQSNVAGKQPQ
jgi:hypothetical protein